jgi:hypothetical protein
MLAKAASGPSKMATLALHLWTQAAASLIALAGFYAIYKNKKNNGAKHFTSMVRLSALPQPSCAQSPRLDSRRC